MQVLTLFSQKGGSGKTTLAVHLGVAALADGQRVAIVDADPQGSACAWAGARKEAAPVVAQASAAQIRQVVAAAREDGHTLLIVDAPPHAKASARDLVSVSDLVAIPVRPTVLDLAALPQGVEVVRSAGRPAIFVLSSAKPRVVETAEVRDALEAGYGWPVARTVIHDRADFARALAQGQAVGEFAPRSVAATEIAALWSELRRVLRQGAMTPPKGNYDEQAR